MGREFDQNRSLQLRHALIASAISIILCLAFGAGSAMATTTHPFIEYIDTATGGGIQPSGVDHDGNIIAWQSQQHTVAKFDTNGNPVNFSALGSNEIDGKGGFDCPTTPSDCDRNPTNGFMQATGQEGNEVYRAVAIDNSGGPADGYIYVASNDRGIAYQGEAKGEVDVFDSTGEFLGTINQSQTFPETSGNESSTVWVDPAGVLYIDHWSFGGGSHVDRYVPVDKNPAHDQFSGQIRTGYGAMEEIAAGLNYAYTFGFDGQHVEYPGPFPLYARYPQAEFHRQGLANKSVSDVFPPGPSGPFGKYGYTWSGCGCGLPILYVDPLDEHVYVGGSGAGFAEFDPQNHQIGPRFAGSGCFGGDGGPPPCHIGDIQAIAIDRSGGPDEGRIYIHGPAPSKIAVFGPPATIPDIENVNADPLHSTAHLSGRIALVGGPAATSCVIEYGTALTLSGYESSTPCTPATPYAADQNVSADLSGLVVEGEYHWRIVVKNTNGQNATPDEVFKTHAVLGVSSDPATNLTNSSADLNGSLNPDGMDTHYRFEYGISVHYNNKTPLLDAGESGGQQSVPPVGISGLQAGRIYHFRIVASNALGKTRGPDETFIVPASPKISGVRSSNLTDTSADLNARIDGLTYDTTYHFDYGPTPNYGFSTPEADLGPEIGTQAVLAHIEGLEPGRTYHYRVDATNKWGTTRSADSSLSFQAPSCPNSHVRQQTNATYLPDCRAYELVSPGFAGSVTFFPGDVIQARLAALLHDAAPNVLGVASNPSRFGFYGGEGSALGLHPPNALIDRYVSTRTNTGWVTTYPGIKGNEGLLLENPQCDMTLTRCMDSRGPNPFGENEAPPTGRYLWDVNGNSLGRLPTNIGVVPNGDHFKGDVRPSPDFSHFVFSSLNVAFAPGGLEESPGTVYDNDVAKNTVVVVSKLTNGDPIPKDPGHPDEYIKIPAVSTDGSHILMSTLASTGGVHLYMRVDDATTYEIGSGELVGMTSDGSKVAFVSTEKLVPEDTDFSADLYLWEEATDTTRILSQGNGNGNSDLCAAFFTEACGVQRVVTERPDTDESMASNSGDVYFYSPEQLDPNNPGVFNERNLYVYRHGSVHYVTTMDPETEADRMQVSPDGDHMAFLSRTQATGYRNVSLDDGGPGDVQEHPEPVAWEEMYTFDPESGEILCASCIPTGQPPTIASMDTSPEAHEGETTKDVKASQSGRFMSNDGRVGFATADALVPDDTNGIIDSYEFSGNRPQLISSGHGERDTQGGDLLFFPTLHSGFEGISQDGTDFYFSTFETLVPEDHNGSFVKFYDARSGGGFPINSPLLPCTAADECHGDSTSAPGKPSFGTSAGLGGGGNLTPQKPTKKKHQGKRRKKHRRHSQHGAGRNHG